MKLDLNFFGEPLHSRSQRDAFGFYRGRADGRMDGLLFSTCGGNKDTEGGGEGKSRRTGIKQSAPDYVKAQGCWTDPLHIPNSVN